MVRAVTITSLKGDGSIVRDVLLVYCVLGGECEDPPDPGPASMGLSRVMWGTCGLCT